MVFGTPWFLLGLLGIGIPVAIHLIRRQRAEKVVLPTMRFLKPAPKKLVYFQQIQQWLLLLLRTAIVGLLAFAFARPIFTGAYSELVGVSPKSTVILLDTSMSMRYADRFEQGKTAALDIIRSMQAGDEAAVVTFSESPDRVLSLTTDLKSLEAFVRSISAPGYRATNYLTAMRSADQVMQTSRYPEKTVVLVTDLQESGIPNGNEIWKLSPGIRLDVVNVGIAETANLVVAAVHLVRQQDNFTLVGRIKNVGTEQVDQVRVTFGIDGVQQASKTIRLQGRPDIQVDFPFTLKQTGMHRGTLAIAGDRFETDNIFRFTLDVTPTLRILGVSGGSTGSGRTDEATWFRSALFQKTGAPFSVDVIDPGRLTIETLASYSVVALLNVGSLVPEQVAALHAYVKGGGGLLLAPADRVDSSSYNRQYGDFTPALLQKVNNAFKGTTLVVSKSHAQRPFFRSLQLTGNSAFDTALFHGYWLAEPGPGSQVLMRFENGDPALIARRVGSGRVLLFTSSLDPKWNDFPLQVTYLPLLHEAMRYLAGSREQKMSYRIGDLVPVPVPTNGAARVTSPVGKITQLRSKPDGIAFFQTTADPGFYRTRSGSLKGSFAVNAALSESELISVKPEEIRDRVILSESTVEQDRAQKKSSIAIEMEKKQQTWWWVLLLVFALSLVETFLANRTYR